VYSYGKESQKAFDKTADLLFNILSDYHRLFDIYYEYDGINNIATINKNAGKTPIKVDNRLIDALLYAKEVYYLTNGATNIAMGSVLKLWHNARENGISNPMDAELPDKALLTEASKHTDIEKVVIDKEQSTVYLADGQMSLDVGAVLKGYAVEMLGKFLKQNNLTSYVINVGGNIKTIGTKPNGTGWVTGVTNPDKSAQSFAATIEIKDTSCVTSGDYERYFTVDGTNYHHIIDPKTLYPARYFSSVTVITENSALADALSTALFVMSEQEGRALIQNLSGRQYISVFWVYPDGKTSATDSFNALRV
jgi:thiamine biosynthesis lipoprotein